MFGIRKKITIGFVSLAIILFSSGVISLLELTALSNSTATLLDENRQNIETAKQMLDAVQDQNTNLLQMIVMGTKSSDSLYVEQVAKFDKSFTDAVSAVKDEEALEEILLAKEDYSNLIIIDIDSVGGDNELWFVDVYKTSYFNLTSVIKNFMIESQENLAGDAAMLESTAHRAITPGILALAVGIIILLMFLFFINTYLIKPVVAMQKSLKGFINYKTPFNVKMEGQDEVFELKENIEELVSMCKNKKF